MEIKDRIAKIIASEGLTQSDFAESIGTGNATITHILSGRNGVSLDVLIKILSAYPHYNTDWLIFGKGDIHKQPVQTSIFDVLGEPQPVAATPPEETQQQSVEADSVPEQVPNVGQPTDVKPQEPQSAQQNQNASNSYETSADTDFAPKTETAVKQIVVLYSDGTFKIYNQH